MIEAIPTQLSQASFEEIHAHVADMVDTDEYEGKPGINVSRYIMARSVGLSDGSARIGGSPIDSIPVVSAAVGTEHGQYKARAWVHRVDSTVHGEVEVVRGEYKATINSPRAAILVASLAARAIDEKQFYVPDEEAQVA